MFTLVEFRIGDDLRINIGDRMVQLRPAQGLRAVEALLRASTRRMMIEEAEKAPERAGGPKNFPGEVRAARAARRT
jgi:hypothetical protein